MPVVGIDLGRNEYTAGGAPGPGVAAGGDVLFAAMPRLSVSRLKRAMVLLANAIPDATGAAVGLIHALVRKTAVDWVNPLDYSEGIGASPVPVACLSPHLIQGKMTIPQSSTATSIMQSMLPLTAKKKLDMLKRHALRRSPRKEEKVVNLQLPVHNLRRARAISHV